MNVIHNDFGRKVQEALRGRAQGRAQTAIEQLAYGAIPSMEQFQKLCNRTDTGNDHATL